MAVGGFGAILAGLGEAVQRSEQNRQRQQMLQMEQAQVQERLKASQQEREAGGLAFPSLLSGGGDLSGLANVGGGSPMPQAPAAPPASMPSMTPGRALTDARASDVPPRGTPEREALKSTIYKYESGDRNVPNYRYDPTHTAGGYGQITDSTWRDVGRDDPAVAAYPNAMSAPREVQDRATDDLLDKRGLSPWVPYNPALAKALGKHDVPTPVHQEMEQTAQKVAQGIPAMAQGRVALQALAQQIEKANPGADPTVKMMALERLHKLLAPSEQQQFQMYMLQNRQEMQLGLERIREEFRAGQTTQAQTAAASRQDKSIEAADARQDKALAAKASPDAKLSPEAVSTMADQYLAGDRTVMQNLGRGAQGSANIVALRAEIAKKMAERGMSGQDMATKMAEFEGLKAGERTLTQRTANIGMRIAEAKQFAPLALAASEKVDRTQFPSFNKLYEAGLTGTGDENIVRLSVATQSLLNAYAAAVTPTGTPTEGAQSRAHELLDKAWSQGQFRVAIDQLMMEMDAASKSPGTVREEFRRGADPALGADRPAGPVIKLDADGNPVK